LQSSSARQRQDGRGDAARLKQFDALLWSVDAASHVVQARLVVLADLRYVVRYGSPQATQAPLWTSSNV
jgi:hypothetical protein